MDENIITFYNWITILLPPISALAGGIITFFITKYKYNRNKPLDKLEIAYNRVYYPIYNLIIYSEKADLELYKKCDIYIKKYKKYVDKATIKSFKYLQDDIQNLGYYINFKNNICKKDKFLRTRLGYLESSMFEMYMFSSNIEKRIIKTFLSFISMYTLLLVSMMVIKLDDETANVIMVILLVVFAIIFTYQLIALGFVFAYEKIKLYKRNKKNKNSSYVN